MIEDAISHYHTLLTQPLLDDARARLTAGIERDNLQFGTRPICNVLRPLFVSWRQYEYIKRESALVLAAIEKLGRHLLQNDALRATLDLTPLEEQAIQIEPGYPAPDVSGRLDAFLNSHDDFSFVEYNADSPGGLLYGDVLGDIFEKMQIVREFQRRFPLRRTAIRPQLLRQLILNYQLFGWWEHPRIAIVDWEGAATHAEFELCRQYFEEKGYSTIIADPRQLEYRGGWLRCGDFKITLVYKRVLVSELLEREGMQTPLIRALRDRAVCVMNSLRVQMLTKKAMFALLDDPAHERLFTVEEISALRRHVPWTRKLRDGKTTYRGRKVELLEHLGANRERMVLKPNSEYGGRGVVLGWQCSDSEWHQAVRDALHGSFVVQERVEVLQQTFPVIRDDQVLAEARYVDFDPYTWSGEHVEGAGVRLSSDALLNVSAGGGSATPLMVIERDLHARW
ncbi:MAG: hypothetical protein HOP19_15545 [Acidobacteria bacterium]|nr:hypothetical protein [Acidobacteriota bacterium]